MFARPARNSVKFEENTKRACRRFRKRAWKFARIYCAVRARASERELIADLSWVFSFHSSAVAPYHLTQHTLSPWYRSANVNVACVWLTLAERAQRGGGKWHSRKQEFLAKMPQVILSSDQLGLCYFFLSFFSVGSHMHEHDRSDRLRVCLRLFFFTFPRNRCVWCTDHLQRVDATGT